MAEKNAKPVQVDDDAAEKDEPAKGATKPLPWLVLVMGLLVMLLTPAASYFVVKLSLPTATPEASAKETAAKESAAKKESEKPDAPALYSMKSMTVNILDTKGTRMLKITPSLVLSVSDTTLVDKLKAISPVLLDAISSASSARTLDELDGPAGRENMKKDILSRVNKILEVRRLTFSVSDVYFEEFLIQ